MRRERLLVRSRLSNLVAHACPRLRDVSAPASCGRPSLYHRYGGHEDDAVDTLLFCAMNKETAGYYGGTGMRVSLVYLPVFLLSFLTMFVVRFRIQRIGYS